MTILQEIFIGNSQKIWSQKRQYILQGLGRGLNTQSELIILKCLLKTRLIYNPYWMLQEMFVPNDKVSQSILQYCLPVYIYMVYTHRHEPVISCTLVHVLSFHAMNPVLDILDLFHISISMLKKWAVLKMMTN